MRILILLTVVFLTGCATKVNDKVISFEVNSKGETDFEFEKEKKEECVCYCSCEPCPVYYQPDCEDGCIILNQGWE